MSALEVWSRQSAIQIHVYLTLPLPSFFIAICLLRPLATICWWICVDDGVVISLERAATLSVFIKILAEVYLLPRRNSETVYILETIRNYACGSGSRNFLKDSFQQCNMWRFFRQVGSYLYGKVIESSRKFYHSCAFGRGSSPSKATGVENRCQITHFLTPGKN